MICISYDFLFTMGLYFILLLIIIGSFKVTLDYIDAYFEERMARAFNKCISLEKPEAKDELKTWQSRYVCVKESNRQIIHYGYIFSVDKEFINFLTLSVQEEKSYLGDITLTWHESMMLRRSVILSISEYDSEKYFKMMNDVLEKTDRNQFPSSNAETLFNTTANEETEIENTDLVFAL